MKKEFGSYGGDEFLGEIKPSCYRSHPALQIDKYEVYGGSASSPEYKDADIYISLQKGSCSGLVTNPWDEEGEINGGTVEYYYPITDAEAPKNSIRFKKMIEWLCNQLQAGKKLHVGCIGGHGRTGLVLSALVATLTDEKDAISYVRKHYCKKVVESSSQVDFLVKHFGVKKVEGTKTYQPITTWLPSHTYSSGQSKNGSSSVFGNVKMPDSFKENKLGANHNISKPDMVVPTGTKVFRPVKGPRSLWLT